MMGGVEVNTALTSDYADNVVLSEILVNDVMIPRLGVYDVYCW